MLTVGRRKGGVVSGDEDGETHCYCLLSPVNVTDCDGEV